MRKIITESGKGKEGNKRWKMERVCNWLFIDLVMLWKSEKVEAMSEEGQRKRTLGGDSVEQTRNKPGCRSPKVEECKKHTG